MRHRSFCRYCPFTAPLLRVLPLLLLLPLLPSPAVAICSRTRHQSTLTNASKDNKNGPARTGETQLLNRHHCQKPVLIMRGGGLLGGSRGGAPTLANSRSVSSDGDASIVPATVVGGRLRDALFPIYGSREVGKFLSLAGIQFFIIFVLTLTRDLKDMLIITSCGAEAISFLKVCPSTTVCEFRTSCAL